jgi:hypothetical protein
MVDARRHRHVRGSNVIQVTVYFWAGRAKQAPFTINMPDGATILDLKNKLVDTNTTPPTPFKGTGVTTFEIASHGDPTLGLADNHTLVNNRSYDARME